VQIGQVCQQHARYPGAASGKHDVETAAKSVIRRDRNGTSHPPLFLRFARFSWEDRESPLHACRKPSFVTAAGPVTQVTPYRDWPS
jgi:hypothetical protein